MAPRKGFYLFARGINLDLTSKKTVNPKRKCLHHKPEMDVFFEEKSDDFPEEVARVDCFINSGKFYMYRESFGLKVVASLFGLLAVLSRSHLGKTALQKSLDGLLFTVRKGRGQ